jgi:hypothetical protein
MAPAPNSQAQIESRVESGLDSTLQGGVEIIEVGREEMNAWKRGFTPQAEIWNGRLAMLGLSIGLGVLLVSRLVTSLTAA